MKALLHHVATYIMCKLQVLHYYMSVSHFELQDLHQVRIKLWEVSSQWCMWEDALLTVGGGIKDVV